MKPGTKRMPQDLRPELIAPCGMDCGLCMGYLREKNTCGGCRAGDEALTSSGQADKRIDVSYAGGNRCL